MEKKYIEIGKRLKELRGSISQTLMGKKFNMPLRTYQSYEYGQRVPPSYILSDIAKEYNTTVEWILTGETELEKARMREQCLRAADTEELIGRIEESLVREEKLIYKYCQGRSASEDKEFNEPPCCKQQGIRGKRPVLKEPCFTL
jgi:transcriptional regulator with XRE-family HTH domain